MRIGILEWICGGGMLDADTDQFPSSLVNEGWLMLSSLVSDCLSREFHVHVALDPRFDDEVGKLRTNTRLTIHTATPSTDRIPESWFEIAQQSDTLLLIAPESDRILQHAIERLSASANLVNCHNGFLNAACDKLLTAEKLTAANVATPATVLASNATLDWLHQHYVDGDQWILKPRDGVGCDAIEILSRSELEVRMRNGTLHSTTAILQPFHLGQPYSRAAIIDRAGQAHWMPLCTQRFTASSRPQYLGGEVLKIDAARYVDQTRNFDFPILELDQLLTRAIAALGDGALGWVGFDLVYDSSANRWLVIEVNPRLTTSFVGLNAACGGGLAAALLAAGHAPIQNFPSQWKVCSYKACM